MEDKKQSMILLSISVLILLVIIGGVVYTLFFTKSFLSKFNDKFNSENITLIYYKQTNCGYCQKQTPILEKLADDYGFEYFEINATNISKSDDDKVIKTLEMDGSTPTFTIVKSGRIISKNVGYMDRSDLFKFLKEAGIVDENAKYFGYTTVSYDEYIELAGSSEPVVITVGQIGCIHCDAIKPALNAVSKNYDVDIYYLDLAMLQDNDRSSFFDSLREMGYDDPQFLSTGSFGTPTTFVFKNSKVKSYISGERTTSQLEKELKKQGVIK